MCFRISCSPLYLASFYSCVEKAEILLLYGADPNMLCTRCNSYGSALHIAALKNNHALAERLIAYGTNLDMQNSQGSTPLHLNICFNNKSSVASLLIRHGARMNGADRFSYTLLAVVIRDMRLDCETLARLMVFAGYTLARELWLYPPWHEVTRDDVTRDDVIPTVPHVPIAAGRVETLCEWLRQMQRNPHQLSDLCRISIRNVLSIQTGGKSIADSIVQLPLPISLKDFVALKEFSS